MSDRETFDIATIVLVYVESVLIFVCNTLIIIAIHRLRSSRTVTHVFILGLTISDLLFGLSAFVIRTLSLAEKEWYNIRWVYLVTLVVYFSMPGMSVLSHLTLALDRYIAVVHATKYKVLLTRRRSVILLASLWVYGFVSSGVTVLFYGSRTNKDLSNVSLTDLIPPEVWFAVAFPNLAISLILTLALYGKVFWKIHKHKRRLGDISGGATGNKKAVAVTKLMVILLSVYLICWCPFAVVAGVDVIYREHADWSNIMYRAGTVLLFVNSFLNSMIYAYKSTEIRKTLMHMFRCQDKKEKAQGASDRKRMSTISGNTICISHG